MSKVLTRTAQDQVADESIPNEPSPGPVLAPSAIAAVLAGQIEDLLKTIEALHGASLSEGISGGLGRKSTGGVHIKDLPPRAMEVLSLMAQGYNNQAIADQLTIALRTVENYIHQIYCTLSIDDDQDVSPRVQAVLEYIDFRLWKPAEKNWN